MHNVGAGSLVANNLAPGAEALRGFLECAGMSEGLRGWALNLQAPGEAVILELLVDGRSVALFQPDQPRGDLEAALPGCAAVGFDIASPMLASMAGPLPPGSTPALTIRFAYTEFYLQAASPSEPMAVAGGFVDLLTPSDAFGWAIIPHAAGPVEVLAKLDGKVLGRSLANIPRRDLARRLGGEGAHGFHLRFGSPLPAGATPEIRVVGGPVLPILHRKDRPAPAAAAAAAAAELPPLSDAMEAIEAIFHSDFLSELRGEAEPAAPPPAGPEADFRAIMAELQESGAFDVAYYLSANPDVAAAGIDPLEHYAHTGWQEDRRPNEFFDPDHYRALAGAEIGNQCPIIHYLKIGEPAGVKPSLLFDPAWYRAQQGMPDGASPLGDYLTRRHRVPLSPLPDFDAEYYLKTYTDVAAAGVEAFQHFFSWGYREGRNPSREFDVAFFTRRYLQHLPDTHPFLYWLENKGRPGISGRVSEDEATAWRELRRSAAPGPHFELHRPLPETATRRVKLLAYYLPQFHAFPENDRWWGTGFTEWTNLARGAPRFRGHYQPRVPRDLGHYDLTHPDVMRRQIDLARASGVHGFVFYFYWFNGHRLMEKPLDAFLADRSIEFPFALMWANENWSRRWDGSERDVLIAQDYRDEDDLALVAEFARHFRDPRYIRVDGRAVLMIYRPGIIPRTRETIARWRRLFEENHGESPLIIMAQAFGDHDPAMYGLDGAVEFPPHKVGAGCPAINHQLEVIDPDFTGVVKSYDAMVEASLAEGPATFPLIRAATPMWDNDPRRQGAGMVLHGSTPAKYEAWLAALCRRATANPFFGEPFVVVNAWNEWAEGAYLEPDQHFGSAYLNATARAVIGARPPGEARTKLVLVGHDALPFGAQELLLNIARTLRRGFGVEVEICLLEGGPLVERYEELGRTTRIRQGISMTDALQAARERGAAAVIVNTTAAAKAVPVAASLGLPCTLLVHELPRIIKTMELTSAAAAALEIASTVVFPAETVRAGFLEVTGKAAPRAQLLIRPQGLYKTQRVAREDAAPVRSRLGMEDGEFLVLCIGSGDLRKGFDLFLQLWRMLNPPGAVRTHFCWLGRIDPGLRDWLGRELELAIESGSFHAPGFVDDVPAYISAADIFALTSREDPFPSVALEAMNAGTPVVAFAGSGGVPDMLAETGAGCVVPFADVPAMAAAIRAEIAQPPEARSGAAQARIALVEARFSWPDYVHDLLRTTLPDLADVSAAVPNYNYARYLPLRLGSILEQTCPIREVLVLDDVSTDDSVATILRTAEETQRTIRLIVNEVNSGSVFRQWRRAAEEARGEFLWIAEADDDADPRLLERLTALLREDPRMVLAFADSRTIDSDGGPLDSSYKPYYATVERGALAATAVFEAPEFVRRFLSVKNLILNVSAVVWRRDALLRALDRCGEELLSYRMAGDWRLYLEALAEPGARIGYEAEPLNVHRRHAQSVTHALKADLHVQEIAQVHALAAKTFGLDESIQLAQQSYVEEVAVQLGAKPRPPTRRRRS